MDWTHLFSAHNSAEFTRVTVTLTPVANCRLQSEDCGLWTADNGLQTQGSCGSFGFPKLISSNKH